MSTEREQALEKALQAGIAEAVTLIARLPDPFATNLRKWVEQAKTALKTEGGTA